MSLKAKIEAVIYASEDPVTLAQLIGLLGQEAQSELDALAAQQESLPLDEPEGVTEADAPTPDIPSDSTAAASAVASDQAASAEPEGEFEASPDTSPAPEAGDASASNAGSDEQDAASAPEASPGGTAAAEEQAANPTPAPDPKAVAADARRVRDYFRSILDQLISEYANDERGLEIREVAGGFRLATKPEYHDAVRGFVKSLKPPLKLSLQALETLAVVAYKQPVTAPEVSEIRGVDSGGVLGSLMARKLVATAGRKQVIGRPILYKTTKEFLLRFGLKDLNELPSIEEFERMAGEFAEAVQEEIPMPEATRRSEEDPTAGADPADPTGVEPMAREHEAQADGTPDDRPYSEERLSSENPSAIEYPADNAAIDGRNVGLDPDYSRDNDDAIDSPEIDAEVQGQAEREGE